MTERGAPRRTLKHVLIVHYHFLPVHNVAVHRLLGYAKRLPSFGWRALVLTRDWRSLEDADPSWGLSWEPHLERDAGSVIYRVPQPAPRRGASFPRFGLGPRGPRASAARTFTQKARAKATRLQQLLFGPYPDSFISWAAPAIERGVSIAGESGIDAILSYCPPETNHVVARGIATRLGVPWVPFFGDLYAFLDAPLPAYSVEALLRKRWHRWCLAPAAACVGVSPAMVDYLATTYGKRTELILTGFDPEDFAGRKTVRRDPRKFVVAHVGSVYPGDQRPDILFDGLDRMIERNPELTHRLEVRFVGSKCDDALHAMLEGRACAAVCAIQSKVDSATALSIVRSSDVLLAFTCTLHRDRHGTLSYPTKVFEAFGARRRVLAVPADGDWVDELLARTGGGTSARNAEEVAAVLEDWFSCWNQEGEVPYVANGPAMEALTRARQVERLARLLDTVADRD